LKKQIFKTLKEESKYIGIIFLICLVAFKIAFFKESFFIIIRNVLALFWLFALPGYFIMLYWEEKLNFLERFIVGITISAVIIGTVSYYVALAGLNIKYHYIILPITLIVLGMTINLYKKD